MSVNFKFRVINPDGVGLAGAEFTLYKISNADEKTGQYKKYRAAVAGKNGIVDFGCIELRNYVMRQTATPDGYGKNGHLYSVTANCDGVMIDCFPE